MRVIAERRIAGGPDAETLPEANLNYMGGGWQLSAITAVRSGNPLTAFVRGNRSRSQWAPSIGPGLGFDRPSMAPGLLGAEKADSRDGVTDGAERDLPPLPHTRRDNAH